MAEDLKPTLTWLDAASVVIGIVIGAGIFVTPQELARLLPSTGAMTLAWVVSGLLVFCGALAFAELSAMLPSTGGLYVYLREAFGPAIAFSSGWVHLLALFSGATAYVASGFSRYLGAIVPLPEGSETLTTLLLIWGLALLAALSTRWAVRLQNITNVAKIVALLGLIMLAFFVEAPAAAPAQNVAASNFGMALATCFFCYEGWSYAGFVAGEMKQPARDLPRAFAVSFLIVVVLYLAVNLAYTRVLTITELQQSGQVGADVARRVLGAAGGQALAAVIVLAIIGTVNGLGLAASRLYYAQARDGLFLPGLDQLHRGTGTPVRAILAHALVTSGFVIFSSSLGFVLQLAISAAWLYYAIAVLGLVRLRRNRPEISRPYRMWGYPLTPVLFVLGTIGFLGSLTAQSPWPSACVIAIMLLSFPVHSWVARANARI